VPTSPPTQLLESWRWEANLGLTRRRRFGDARKREMPEGIHTKGSGSGVITSLGMESGSHAHRSALHPLPCSPCGYLEYDHEVNLRWGAPMMLTTFSGIGTSRSRSLQDPSVAHDRDGAVDLHHPQQHYYTMVAVLIRRGFPSLSNAHGVGVCAGILPVK